MNAAPKKSSGVGEVLVAVGVILPALAVVAAAIVVALPYIIVAAAVVVAFALVTGLAMSAVPRGWGGPGGVTRGRLLGSLLIVYGLRIAGYFHAIRDPDPRVAKFRNFSRSLASALLSARASHSAAFFQSIQTCHLHPFCRVIALEIQKSSPGSLGRSHACSTAGNSLQPGWRVMG
jgi:hypothetical protein